MSVPSSPVIALFGAGPGLGASVARRFGQEGFRVALVGRREEPLRKFAEVLNAEGIEAAHFSSDLSDPARVPSLVADIRERFGRIDVVEYGPSSAADQGFVPAAQLDAVALEKYMRLFLFTPVEIVRQVLPELIERGSGAILVTHGSSSAMGIPFLSGVGPAMAAMRNYLYSLNGELEGTGVYAGTLTIGALISTRGPFADQGLPREAGAFNGFPTVHPDTLAGLYWDMYVQRLAVERTYPERVTAA